MKHRADIIKFPLAPIRREDADGESASGRAAATIIVLPVVRIERYDDVTPRARRGAMEPARE